MFSVSFEVLQLVLFLYCFLFLVFFPQVTFPFPWSCMEARRRFKLNAAGLNDEHLIDLERENHESEASYSTLQICSFYSSKR